MRFRPDAKLDPSQIRDLRKNLVSKMSFRFGHVTSQPGSWGVTTPRKRRDPRSGR